MPYLADGTIAIVGQHLDQDADAAGGVAPEQLRRAIELVEDTRERFLLNVAEDLACEALAYAGRWYCARTGA